MKVLSKFRRVLSKKEEGSFLEIVVSLMIFVVILVMFIFFFRTRIIKETSELSRTNLVVALLGGAVIDTEIYGANHDVAITDFEASRDAFLDSLKHSYNLDENNVPASAGSVIVSGITVHEYSVWSLYDRNNNDVYDGAEYWSYQDYNVPSYGGYGILETNLYNKSKTVEHEYYDLLSRMMGLSGSDNSEITELIKSPAKLSEEQWIAYQKFLGKYEDPITGDPSDENWNMHPSSVTSSDEWAHASSSENILKKALEGSLKTPDDVNITHTTVYGDIGFWVGGVGWKGRVNIFNPDTVEKDSYYIHLAKSVDIVNEESLDFTK